MHDSINAVDLFPHSCLDLCADALLVFVELLPQVCKLHSCLVELFVVAEPDLLCQVRLEQEDVVFEQAQLARGHVQLIDEAISL